MNRALAQDTKGNALMAFLPTAHVADVPDDAPMPAALVAVWCGRHLLLVFDRFRGEWELPGGGIDPGETPLQAAVRELHEESGLHLPTLTLAGYARFRLVDPPRDEYAAIYTAHVPALHHAFTPNQEISAIRWWDTAGAPPGDTQVIDVVLAQHTRLRQHPQD
ncbi:NUDIX hydrolase [Streptosporangium sp. NBC_01469]|uniref:NUDIX hydrolase n=1 Tax=Streptosporangium sp. NBC_01469 TaxID=2903898 RepID=UPI002E2C3FC4|nr:NUDIX hydrolase [Streptosporangium sp. NBC_01469]